MSAGPGKMHALAQDGDARLLSQALRAGGDPNAPDGDGMSPLHYAAWYGHPQCCQVLLSANANIDAFDHDGASALHAAAYNGQLGCVLMLVESGANAFSADNENQTPKDAAIAEKHKDIVDYLRAVEEDQRREAEVTRCAKLLADAQQHAKQFKPELARAIKDAKKKQAALAKQAKKERKVTLKLKRERMKARGSATTGGAPQPSGGGSPSGQSRISTVRKSSSSSVGSSSNSAAGRAGSAAADAPTAGAGGDEVPRPLPDLPSVSPEVAAEMVLAEFEADSDGKSGIVAFLASLDLKDFARLITKDVPTLEALQKCTAADLQRMGLPTGARKKIIAALHPK